MDPYRLRLLRELGDRGSVAAVAAAMHVSASAVSQQLALLQSTVPAPLTVKRGRNLTLTSAGERLAAAGARVEYALAEARETAAALSGEDDRVVTVSAFHSAALALFPRLLDDLAGAVRLNLADADVAHDQFPGLTADYDLVIAHRLSHAPDWPQERLIVRSLMTEELDVALPEAHPLAAQTELHPEQLIDEPWIATHDGFPLTAVLDAIGALGGGALRVEHRINELFVAAHMVRTARALAIMPRTTGALLDVAGVVLRPVAGLSVTRHIDVLARPDALTRNTVTRVLDALVALTQSGPSPS